MREETEVRESEEPVDVGEPERTTEDRVTDVVRSMGLQESYFGAKAVEALCEYGAHREPASIERASRYLQREMERLTTG